MTSRLFAYGLAGFERNERRRLDLRSRAGGGIGWRLKASGRTNLAVLGGMTYAHERYRHEANRGAGEGLLGVEWDAKLFRQVELATQFTIFPDVLNARNLRMEFDAELRVPIARQLTYTLRLFDRFDTTPATGVERNDYGLVSGVGVFF